MNKKEAATVLAVFASAYAREIDQAQAQAWFGSALERVDYTLGREVAARIVEDDQFFPTPARFNEVRRAVERAHEPTVAALPPAPQSPAQVDRVRQIIEKTRAKLQGKTA